MQAASDPFLGWVTGAGAGGVASSTSASYAT